jgi:hypothetical protein
MVSHGAENVPFILCQFKKWSLEQNTIGLRALRFGGRRPSLTVLGQVRGKMTRWDEDLYLISLGDRVTLVFY